jgi:hypothetical protein
VISRDVLIDEVEEYDWTRGIEKCTFNVYVKILQ